MQLSYLHLLLQLPALVLLALLQLRVQTGHLVLQRGHQGGGGQLLATSVEGRPAARTSKCGSGEGGEQRCQGQQSGAIVRATVRGNS